MKFEGIKTAITWVKDRWNEFKELDSMTHTKFKLTANSKVDHLIGTLQNAAGWIVTIITGAGTFFMVNDQLSGYEVHPWVSYGVSSVIAFFMWMLTDRTLANMIEIVIHNTLMIFYRPFWADFGKCFRFGRLKPVKQLIASLEVKLQTALYDEAQEIKKQIDSAKARMVELQKDGPRYSISSRFIQVGFTCLMGFLIFQAYMMDKKAVQVIQQPIADRMIQDTSRNVKAERAAIIAQTQPNIDRLTAEIAVLNKAIEKAWDYSVNHPSVSQFKKLIKEDNNGWAKGEVKRKFYNNYLAGLTEKRDKLEAERSTFTKDQNKTLRSVSDEVTDFNEDNKNRSARQTALVFGVIFTFGYIAKQAYGAAVALRTMYYIAETNGGIDVDGNGVVDTRDMQAYYAGQSPAIPVPDPASNF